MSYRFVFGVFLAFTLLFLANLVFACPLIPANTPPGGECVQVDGYSMYLHSAGRGKPAVVFEAGLGWGSPTWKQVAPEVAKFAQAVVYDRVGLGRSSLLKSNSGPVSAQQVVNRLKALLTKAHIPPPYILVGQSIGGLYIQLFAREYPKDVAGLILVDSVSVHDAYQDPLPKPSAPYYHEAQGVSESKVQVKDAPVFPDIPVTVLAVGRHKWATDSMKKKLLAAQINLAKISPESRFMLVKNSGHYIQNDQPQVVISAIRSLYARETVLH